MSLLRLRNLSFHYEAFGGEKVTVLKNLNLDIERGELIAIQGPSGSGKSTLLYILGCLLNTYTGQVEIDGQDISLLNDEELAFLRNEKIGFVFQQFHLLPKATVWENILLPSRYPFERPNNINASERAEALIKGVGLEERTNHFPNQLSGGQQQRVSIARALLNNTELVLADEPTGSLDTKNSQQIMELLKTAHRAGRTIIVITHDPEISAQCEKVIHFRDGEIKEIVENRNRLPVASHDAESLGARTESSIKTTKAPLSRASRWSAFLSLLALAVQSLKQNRSRSMLTMLGIVIGVAAVLSMVTVGAFTKRKILDSYAAMGVNTLGFYGYANWDLRATDQVPTVYQSFDWNRDLMPLKQIFPKIVRLSPTMFAWNNKASFAGRVVETDVRVIGASHEALGISNRKLILGTNFSVFHQESRSPVCVIGYDIYARLFPQIAPIGQVIHIVQQDSSFTCRVMGVLESITSNKEWSKPNLQIYIPFTYYVSITDSWGARIREFIMQVKEGTDVVELGKKVKSYFDLKYGKSIRSNAESDSVLVAQMNKFLSLFTVLLGAIALVSLAVGGIGITNMMLVSVSERFKEIGIRKAFGATNRSIRYQYLVESILICSIAGLVGLVVGFVLYQSAVWGATKLVANLTYEWMIHWPALGLSLVSIFGVGVLSGLTPALKAEELQVIEALRSE